MAYTEQGITAKKILQFSVFLALLTFAIHFMLQTVTRSVLSDALPEYMMQSYFSVLLLYLVLSFAFFVIYFVVYYDYLTFAEIGQNKWYILVKMGFSPGKMIFQKYAARLAEIAILYTVGFLLTVLVSSFLKYPFVWGYMISLYLAGLMNVFLVVTLIMTLSPFVKQRGMARWLILLIAFMVLVLNITSGFYEVLSNRTLMTDPGVLFDTDLSVYWIYVVVLIGGCIVISSFRAKNIAKYSNFDFYKNDMDFEKGVEIVDKDGESAEYFVDKAFRSAKKKRVANVVVNVALTLVILCFVAFNVLVLSLTLVSADEDADMFGVIPYVFQSETMEPTIMYNDLALFEKINPQEVREGDVILFKKGETVSIARVQEDMGDELKVDIDYYPAGSQKGIYEETVEQDSVYGRYQSSNRWLGALILFANTVFGRLLMLLVPVVLLFFYKPITKFFKNVSHGAKE